MFGVLDCGPFDQLPLVALHVFGHVDVANPIEEVDVELIPVVGPRPELKVTTLNIEREILYVNLAGALEYRRRNPDNASIVLDNDHGVSLLLQARVGAARPINR